VDVFDKEDFPDGLEIPELNEENENGRFGLWTKKTKAAFAKLKTKPLEDLKYEEEYKNFRFDEPKIFDEQVSGSDDSSEESSEDDHEFDDYLEYKTQELRNQFCELKFEQAEDIMAINHC